MRRQNRQNLLIHLLLAAMLLAPLQVFASVYASVDKTHVSVQAPGHDCTEKEGSHGCREQQENLAQQADSHCNGDMDCSQHCNNCSHCQFYVSLPFTILHAVSASLAHGADIAYFSHIPQVDYRPPIFS